MSTFVRPNPASGVPIYLQLSEQVKDALETGALRPGDPLPGVHGLAEELVVNPNAVARAYRELEAETSTGAVISTVASLLSVSLVMALLASR